MLLHTEVAEIGGDKRLEGIAVVDNETGERRTIDARALFIFIGAVPGTAWLGDVLALDSGGYVLTGADVPSRAGDGGPGPRRQPYPLETSQSGVFAVGDVRHGATMRVATAVGEGAMAIRLVHEHLADRHQPARTRRRRRLTPARASYSGGVMTAIRRAPPTAPREGSRDQHDDRTGLRSGHGT